MTAATTHAQSLLDAARAYANAGARIFPVPPRSKVPYPGTHAFKDARADASPWADGTPHNIGFVPASLGLVAVDVDKPQHWEEAQRWGLLAEPTFEVTTGRGAHLYFRGVAPTGSGVDNLVVRGGYGYTLLPPSVHPSGAVYATHDTFADAKPLPPAFAARLAQNGHSASARERVRAVFTTRRIVEGNRHPALLTLAGHLASIRMDESFALEVVHAWNAQYCDPPKGAPEVTRLVADVYAKERAKSAASSSLLFASHNVATVAPIPSRAQQIERARRKLGGGRR